VPEATRRRLLREKYPLDATGGTNSTELPPRIPDEAIEARSTSWRTTTTRIRTRLCPDKLQTIAPASLNIAGLRTARRLRSRPKPASRAAATEVGSSTFA
jgi:hypothetical protein